MQIRIDKIYNCVEVWLTNAESKDNNILSELKKIYSQYKNTKYKVAVFYSGNTNLCEATEGLIWHNKNVSNNSL